MDVLRVVQQFKINDISADSGESEAPLVCPAGQFNNGVGCQQCPVNTFRYVPYCSCYFKKFINHFYSFGDDDFFI